MHSSSPSEVKLKSDVFDTLLKVFDLDPRTRAGFREVGGFVYVMSVLINMEGSLADPISAVWKNGKYLPSFSSKRGHVTEKHVLIRCKHDMFGNQTFEV